MNRVSPKSGVNGGANVQALGNGLLGMSYWHGLPVGANRQAPTLGGLGIGREQATVAKPYSSIPKFCDLD
jgi:hypothetical protein